MKKQETKILITRVEFGVIYLITIIVPKREMVVDFLYNLFTRRCSFKPPQYAQSYYACFTRTSSIYYTLAYTKV
jgi:hypothetical protein